MRCLGRKQATQSSGLAHDRATLHRLPTFYAICQSRYNVPPLIILEIGGRAVPGAADKKIRRSADPRDHHKTGPCLKMAADEPPRSRPR